MAINLSTAGVKLAYAVEETAGARPTSGYTRIYGAKTTPSLNPSPDTLETTTLDELEYKTYIDGLKDLGGALEFTFNLTELFITTWDALIEAYETAKASGKSCWFLIDIPGISEGFFFRGNPAELGLPAIEVNSVLETTVYITPTGAPQRATKPTA